VIERPVPLILGHNPLIGVDHLSQERGRDRQERFAETQRILDLIRSGADAGVDGLMLSTHQRVRELLPSLAADTDLRTRLHVYPIIPYVAGYVRRSNETGLTSTITEAVRQAARANIAVSATRALLAAVTRRPYGLLASLIDAELASFRGLRVDALFLHNVLTDLLLGWGAGEVLAFFARHVSERHGIRPGFVTMNYPRLVAELERAGVARPLVLASFNKLGFQMNPSKQACEDELRRGRSDVIAMSVFASGLLRPDEAADYVANLDGAESVVFGASTPEHITETSRLFRDALSRAGSRR